MAKVKVKPEYKELVNMFNKLCGSKSLWQVYNDCITMYAISIQNAFTFGKRFEQNEQEYLRIASGYSKPQLEYISLIFAKIISMADDNPFRDLLGDLYMQLNFGSDALGQVFTPYNMAKAVSEITVKDVDVMLSMIEEKGFVRILEPACGGGAMVIALCENLKNVGIDYQKECVIVCQDLSRIAALMCYIVLSLLGVAAVIKIGDTLSDPYTDYYSEIKNGSELWTTPMFHVNNCYGKV